MINTTTAALYIRQNEGWLTLHGIRDFLRFARRKPLVLVYSFVLTAAVLFLYRFVSFMDYLSGLALLGGSSPLDSIVSVAQLAVSPGVRLYALAGACIAAAVSALVFALAFTGALGAMARGAADVAGFPCKPGMGAGAGYKHRYAPLAATLFFELLALILIAFLWLVAAIPLAVVNKAAEYGVLSHAALWLLAAITAFVLYAGLLAWRALAIALIPPIFSDRGLARRRALRFCGARFFSLVRRFVVADIMLAFFVSLHRFFGNAPASLLAVSAYASLSMAYLAFAAFMEYTAYQAHYADRPEGADGEMAATVDEDDGGAGRVGGASPVGGANPVGSAGRVGGAGRSGWPNGAGGQIAAPGSVPWHEPEAGNPVAAHGVQAWLDYDGYSDDGFDDDD